MGEAKRRKDFRVPRGKVGITVDVDGEDPSTLLFDSALITALADEIEQAPGRPSYRELVPALAKEFVACKRSGKDFSGVGIGILWSALYHPQQGAMMRARVSRALREKGCAHITWRLSEAGLALALSDRFVNLDEMLAAAPRDAIVTAFGPQDDESAPH